MRWMFLIACCLCVTTVRAQKYDCPMRNGVVIEAKQVGFIPPHTDPNNGMVIYSSTDSVFCAASGKVIRIYHRSEKAHALIVRVDPTILMVYSFMEETSLQENDTITVGQYLGKSEREEGKFRLKLALFKGSTTTDPRPVFNCLLTNE